MARTTTHDWVRRIAIAMGVAVVAALVLRVGDSRSDQIEVRDPTAWLYQRQSGELVQANATTGEILARVAVGAANDDVAVAQAGSGALALDRTKGDAVFVDGVTQKVGARTPLPGVDGSSHVAVTGNVAQIVTSTVVQSVDAATGAFGAAVKLERPVADPVLLVSGRTLGLVDSSVVAIADAVSPPSRPLGAAALGASSAGVFAVDGAGSALVRVRDDGRLANRRCLGAAMSDPISSRGFDAAELAVLDAATGTLAVIDPVRNRCHTAILAEARGATAPPVVAEGRVFVPLVSTGEVAVVRASDGNIISRFAVNVPAGRDFDLFTKDGLVWVNDPRGSAAVINEAGLLQRFDKTGSGVGGAGTGGTRAGPGDRPGIGPGAGTGSGGAGNTGTGSGETPGSGPERPVAGTGPANAGGPPPGPQTLVADFEFSTSVANVDQVVTFTDRSLGGPTAWTWDFGDGTFGSGAKVTHAWKTPGTYTVTLRVDNATQSSRASATIRVVTRDVKERPKADFTVSSQRVEVGGSVVFTSQSKGNPTDTRWNFGDSTTASGTPVSKSWTAAGIYTVTLTVANSEGSDSRSTQITVFDRVEPPVAVIAADIRDTIVGQTIALLSQSRGNPTDLRWNFGDGTPVLSGQTVRHAWGAPGQYTVTLTAANSAGSHSASVTINVREPVIVPVARINASALTVAENEAVRFSSLSINRPDLLAWDFGDGTTAAGATVTKAWARAGSYTVSLTATNSAGSNVANVVVTVVPNIPPPVAAFDVAPATPEVGVALTFTDRSTGATEWQWDFGDGTASNLQNPTKIYTRPGTYTVRLVASNRAGSNPTQRALTVRIPLPAASFTFAPTAPQAGQAVQFTDTSTGNPTTWVWTFSDGGTVATRNPSHTFPSAGTFTVTLTVTNESGPSTTTRSVVVNPPPPVAAFSFVPAAPLVGTEVAFTNTSTGGPGTTFAWDFGDGSSSAAASPRKTYAVAGSYAVRFTVTNASGSSVATRTVTVAVPAPVAAIGGPAAVGVGVPVQFANNSTGGPATTVLWEFGDGTTSALLTPAPKVYAAAAPYTVRLTMTNASGSSTATHRIVVTAAAPVVQSIVVNSQVPPYVAGQSLTFVAAVTGGTAPYTQYNWTFEGGVPASSVTAGPQATASFGSAGARTVTVRVTDSAGQVSAPFAATFTIVAPPTPPPTVTVASPSPLTGAAPRDVTITATPTGGVLPVTVRWTLPPGAALVAGTLTTPTITARLAVPGTYAFSVTATDSAVPPRTSPPAGITFTATAPPPTTAGAAYVPIDGLMLALFAALGRRRRRS